MAQTSWTARSCHVVKASLRTMTCTMLIDQIWSQVPNHGSTLHTHPISLPAHARFTRAPRRFRSRWVKMKLRRRCTTSWSTWRRCSRWRTSSARIWKLWLLILTLISWQALCFLSSCVKRYVVVAARIVHDWTQVKRYLTVHHGAAMKFVNGGEGGYRGMEAAVCYDWMWSAQGGSPVEIKQPLRKLQQATFTECIFIPNFALSLLKVSRLMHTLTLFSNTMTLHPLSRIQSLTHPSLTHGGLNHTHPLPRIIFFVHLNGRLICFLFSSKIMVDLSCSWRTTYTPQNQD